MRAPVRACLLRRLFLIFAAFPRCRFGLLERKSAITEALGEMLTHEGHSRTTNQGGFSQLPILDWEKSSLCLVLFAQDKERKGAAA